MIKIIVTTLTSVLIGLGFLGALFYVINLIHTNFGANGLLITQAVFVGFFIGELIKMAVRDIINRKKGGW